MPFVTRDQNGDVISVFSRPQALGQEYVDDLHPSIVAFHTNNQKGIAQVATNSALNKAAALAAIDAAIADPTKLSAALLAIKKVL